MGFNQDAYQAFTESRKNNSISPDSKVVETRSDSQVESSMRALAESHCNAIIAVGINVAGAVSTVASQFPHVHFVMVDARVNQPNVRSIVFREDQGAFLMGVIAGLKSRKTGTIGFVGGMDVPLIKRFEMAYTAGAKYINPKIKVLVNYVGISVDAWNDVPKAEEIAWQQYNSGAQVIFHGAGRSGLGVFDAAERMHARFPKSLVFAEGCDVNQDCLHPGLILTSMLKNIKKAIFDVVADLSSQTQPFASGVVSYDLTNQGVAWTLDNCNKALFSKKEILRIKQIEKGIIQGTIAVPDYFAKSKDVG